MAKEPLINIDADLDDADWPKRRPPGTPPATTADAPPPTQTGWLGKAGAILSKTGVLLRGQKYNPEQPRVPAGTTTGGQWTHGLGGLLATIGQPDGGFTYSPVRGTPRSGYALSIYKGRERVLDKRDVTLAALARYARDNRDLLAKDGNYLGGWHNPADGKVYLDISTVVQDERQAAKLAREYHQIAYFDLQRGVSIPTPSEVH